MRRSVAEFWKGGKAYRVIAQREKEGKPVFTNNGIANARADICADCDLNIKPDNKLIRLADKVVLQRTGDRTTKKDYALHNCDACSCPLKVLAHLRGEVLRETKSAEDLKERIEKREKETGKKPHSLCWLKRLFNI